ncbi:transposase [Pedobacter frigiditerrae]|uniref:Transposase n=1 Tax=Pedobacter frigiditerrae TaxID=2530452 RepID=A0A4R0MZ72_9SPHI|nr:transposase [Pedobacter frigiditerrae]TCC92233.1 transposase [Pedobacter frigiditerrae]
MEFIEDSIYHIYNRGNNRQQIFFTDENYLFFLEKIRSGFSLHCEILSYCLMPNHFHFIVLIKSKEDGRIRDLNSAIAIILRSYTRAVQKQENFTGSLFQQKTKAKKLVGNVNETVSYLSICAHYIHQNPLKAGLVKILKDWKYSSYPDYVGLRNGSLCNRELFYAFAGISKEQFLIESETLVSEKLQKDLF